VLRSIYFSSKKGENGAVSSMKAKPLLAAATFKKLSFITNSNPENLEIKLQAAKLEIPL